MLQRHETTDLPHHLNTADGRIVTRACSFLAKTEEKMVTAGSCDNLAPPVRANPAGSIVASQSPGGPGLDFVDVAGDAGPGQVCGLWVLTWVEFSWWVRPPPAAGWRRQPPPPTTSFSRRLDFVEVGRRCVVPCYRSRSAFRSRYSSLSISLRA